MKIKQIEINGLFGMFNHIVPFNLTEHITIIYGINGIGKTMLFKILDSLFNLNLIKLVNYPFENLNIEFDNKETLKLLNTESTFNIEHNSNNVLTYDLSKYKIENLIKSEDILKGLKTSLLFKNSENKYFNDKTRETLSFDQLIEKISKHLHDKKNLMLKNENELINLIKKINLYFIQTQRLTNDDYFLREIPTVKKYSKELSELIQEKHREYANQSEMFELSLGTRLRNKEIKTFLDIDELKKENKILEAKRSELKSVGLFKSIEDDYSNIPDNIDEIERAILSVNIQDMKNKLKIFDELYQKLNIFLDVLNNKRFTYKKISINQNDGFVFFNENGVFLDVTELSSGEQHEIVLLYELLFKIPENSLVLIDEPEISLHVMWQKDFLKDLENIVKIRNFDILIATHSPSIINGNWDLTVELIKDKINER